MSADELDERYIASVRHYIQVFVMQLVAVALTALLTQRRNAKSTSR